VAKGEALLVMEAMKMEHTLRAPAAGRVSGFRCQVGEQVKEGSALVDFEVQP
jgi:3-methylcrotonyl-CoA carboxylase alpha subunit